jgi:hypothetical protein
MKPIVTAAVVALLAMSTPALARVWHVNPGGTGDAPTIQAAIDSAAVGDTVSLADGNYTGAGNREIDCYSGALTIVSESGDPNQCVITCSGSAQDCTDDCTAFHFRSTEPGAQRLEGVTITGWCGGVVCEANSCPAIANCIFRKNHCLAAEIGNPGAGLRCLQNSRPTITDCVFQDNQAMYGAGIWSHEAYLTVTRVRFVGNGSDGGSGMASGGGIITVTQCEFRGNIAGSAMSFSGGAGLLCYGSGVLTDCVFDSNSDCGVGGGACFCPAAGSDEHLHVEGCTFVNNQAWPCAAEAGGGGLAAFGPPQPSGSLDITNCTFVGNAAADAWYEGGGLLVVGNVAVDVANTIIAFGGGGGVACSDAPTPTFTCCDIVGNVGGDWTGCITGQSGVSGNFSELPYFCDREAGDFALQSTSFCLPANHPYGHDCGGAIGAFGEGCSGGPATEPTTWGAVKAIYR